MRRVLCLAAFLVAGPVLSQEKPKPNTLTPKEIADGWVLLFDGETTFGWKIDGAVEVKDGMMILGKDGKKGVAYPTTCFGLNGRIYCEVEGEVELRVPVLSVSRAVAEEWAFFDITHSKSGRETSMTVEYSKQTIVSPALEFPKESHSSPVVIRPATKDGVRVRNVKFKPTHATPLFNGKNLDGWKVFPGEKYKSKFAVTPRGELSVKDGPGDLQTEKAFGDFVLQLECKTNGKALNSGVFFRCLADQYQQGYEAQIQNAYLGDRTNPVDFGTGAIYRRVKARKVVADDGEWFTMTVAADGKHVATWVNGYQTVDWTDDRPAEENARKGYRAGKGHLSIQGHDPTTDLLFRNIRIAELK